MRIQFFPKGTGILPKKFTLKNDWIDGGDYDKSMGIIVKTIFLIILMAVLFAKVFNNGVKLTELLGFSCLAAACLWVAGLIRFEVVEGEKTMWNQLIWGGLCLVGILFLFA